jgi:thioredoxin reductase
VADVTDTLTVDVLIVGAGPVGLFGAYYSGVRSMSTAVLDSLPEPGGQISAMYPREGHLRRGWLPGDPRPRPR